MAKKNAPKPSRPEPAKSQAGPPRFGIGQIAPGFYSDYFTAEEVGLVAEFVSDLSVDDEIWLQRVINRRLLEQSQVDDVELLIRVVRALGVGTGRVARLLRDKRALSGEAADGIAGAIAQALDELGSELGLEL